jgi:hypothetical protein
MQLSLETAAVNGTQRFIPMYAVYSLRFPVSLNGRSWDVLLLHAEPKVSIRVGDGTGDLYPLWVSP